MRGDDGIGLVVKRLGDNMGRYVRALFDQCEDSLLLHCFSSPGVQVGHLPCACEPVHGFVQLLVIDRCINRGRLWLAMSKLRLNPT